MTILDRQRLEVLFDAAIELPVNERIAYVARECGDDEALRVELERWLAADASLDAFLETPPDLIAEALGASLPPQAFGAWRVLRVLGTGGMGTVWLAERTDGEFEQRVAIKEVAVPTPGLLQRFRQERRILARLDHPNIAHLIDGGVDARGAPYVVMEYVDGVPVTVYAREHRLVLPARIGLVLPILDAVQYAHSQLVVHRDIKPGNVLVDRQGVPKLLDFGIAKLLDAGAGADMATHTGLRALTPEYASPEQVRGEIVGPPSDIYSIGVLLYELVAGARPYRIEDTSPSGIERTICETEPVRPSARSGAAKGNAARDLDAVLLKALAKQPAQRYASCAEFAADLNRLLCGEAVIARVPTTRERVQRYVRRHRLAVAVAATALIALVVGLATTLYFYRQSIVQRETAIRERDRAEQQSAVAEAVKEFLNEDVIRAASPYLKTSPADVTVREAIDRGAGKVEDRFKGQPAIEGEVRAELGNLYVQLAQYPKAETQFRTAAGLLERTLGVADAKTLFAQYALAFSLVQQSKNAEAEALLLRADAAAHDADARAAVTRDQAWGGYWYNLGQGEKAQPYIERSIAEFQRWQPDNVLMLAVRRVSLVNLYMASGRIESAERLAHDILATLEAQGERETFGYGIALATLGRAQFFRHDYVQAEAMCTRAATLLRKISGRDTPYVADAVTILNRLQLATGRYAEGAANARAVYEAYLVGMGEHSFGTQAYLAYMGHSEYMAGQTAKGIRDAETGIAALASTVPADHISVQLVKFFLAGDYLDAGASHLESARTIVDKLDPAALQRVSPEGDWPARLDALRGQIAYYDGDAPRAKALLEPALTAMRTAKSSGFEIERTQRTLARLAAAK